MSDCRLYSLHYQTVEINLPPNMPMPGITGTHDIPTAGSARPVNLRTTPATFLACCRLWVIYNDVLWEYHNHEFAALTSLAFAEEIFRRLLAWAASLPAHLAQGSQNGHAEVIMQYVDRRHIPLNSFLPNLHHIPPSVELRFEP